MPPELLAGILAGTLSASALMILVEKMSRVPKALVFGHYVLVDIVATIGSYTLLPVIGLATLVNAAVFCIIFTTYLYWRRGNSESFTLWQVLTGKVK
jgi:hypothetical protein